MTGYKFENNFCFKSRTRVKFKVTYQLRNKYHQTWHIGM